MALHFIMGPDGNPIGTIALFEDTIPEAIMNGRTLILSGSWVDAPEPEFKHFYISPAPAEKKEDDPNAHPYKL